MRAEPALLSERQLAVLKACALGRNQQDVARELGVSHQTVKNHLLAAYRVLGVKSLMGAVAEMGWVEFNPDSHEEPATDAGGARWTIRHRRA